MTLSGMISEVGPTRLVMSPARTLVGPPDLFILDDSSALCAKTSYVFLGVFLLSQWEARLACHMLTPGPFVSLC